MPGEATKLGPFTGGLHNASGSGEFIQNEELYELVNLEVDTDGSLVNRPQINNFTITGVDPTGASFIGTYLPNDGRKFLVLFCPSNNSVHLINAITGASVFNSGAGLTAVCSVQYGNKLWIPAKTGSTNNGGYFDVPTPSTVTWTAVPTMPKGEAAVQYRDRMFIACGLSATSDTSRVYFSAITDPTVWTPTPGFGGLLDVAPGNGQKLVDVQRLGNDLILFKEHSTHKFTFTTDPRKGELNEVDATIGVPAINCTVLYKNNTIYALHDNAVYELFQFTYTRISDLIYMDQITDLDLFSKDQYGLTLHRDRLFVRYFKYLYVYSRTVKCWSTWESTRKFSKAVVIPSASVGLDTAYAMSASQSSPAQAYQFQDVRITTATGPNAPVGVENYQGRITTKTMDFDVPQSYKVLFWWGIAVATSGNFTATMVVPNAAPNKTWQQAKTQYGTWAAAVAAGQTWASNVSVSVATTVLPTLGRYARKFIKLFKKVRFRQVYFTVTFDVITNGGVADASLRIYDLTVLIKQKETVVKETS
jgi:hypothetical protein